jgi:hypothetical protein
MTLTPVQAAHRAAHRARLEVESKRAANSRSDVPRLLEWRDFCRETMRSKRDAILVMEDDVFSQLIQIVHIQRRLFELGYTGN